MWWAEAARVDEGVIAPDARSLARTPRSVQAALRALSGSKFFSGLALRAMVFDLHQVRRYRPNPTYAPEFRSRWRRQSARTPGVYRGALVGVGGGLRGGDALTRAGQYVRW